MKVTELKENRTSQRKDGKVWSKTTQNFELIAIVLGSGIKGCNDAGISKKN
ncbi:MAG: hypothetical protein H6782_00515 [Candidatus Nomurabacteria bacterium]|nr:MAG: hypothetical protein H6782_00515 [Candidatus Nomurabacteria bacterium]